MILRKHQREMVKAGEDIRSGSGKTILAHVVPGGGKSWLPMLLKSQLPDSVKIGWFVPRDNLRQQAALDAQQKFGVVLNDCGNQIRPSDSTAGFVTTHQSLTTNPDLWRDEFRRQPYICVIDELHHAWLSRDGNASALTKAIGGLRYHYLLSMTGTLERNDSNLIYTVDYCLIDGEWQPNPKNSADHFIRYTREDALTEGAISPIEFHHFDGPVKWFDGAANEEIEWQRLSEVDRDDAAAGLFTALKTEYAKQLFSSCLEHWRVYGQKLLVVCTSQSDAKQYYKQLKGEPGGAYLAIEENDAAGDHIKRFRASQGRSVLVTCMMAYEGLDVPAISHICTLTQIRSTPWIYQMLARAWRVHPGKPVAYCFCPDDPRMNAVIRRIKEEETRVLRDTSSNGNGKKPGDKAGEVLPLSGLVEDIRRSALDGTPTSQAQTEFAAIVRKYGMDLNHPKLREAYHVLGQQVTVPTGNETYDEVKRRLSRELASYCRRRDNERGVDFGTTQRTVSERMGWKKTENMTPDELKAAFRVATNI